MVEGGTAGPGTSVQGGADGRRRGGRKGGAEPARGQEATGAASARPRPAWYVVGLGQPAPARPTYPRRRWRSRSRSYRCRGWDGYGQQQKIVLAKGEKAFYAMGLLTVEEDLEKLDLDSGDREK